MRRASLIAIGTALLLSAVRVPARAAQPLPDALRAATGRPWATVPLATVPAESIPSLSSDLGWNAYDSKHYRGAGVPPDFYLQRVDNSVKRLIKVTGDIRNPENDLLTTNSLGPFSPNGKFLLLYGYPNTYSADQALWSWEISGTHVSRISPAEFDCGTAAWSPDGKRVAFTARAHEADDSPHPEQYSWRTYVAERDGSEPRRIAPHMNANGSIAWFPDGKSLLIAGQAKHGTGGKADSALNKDIAIVTLDSGHTSIIGHGVFPSFSPDGEHVLFFQQTNAGSAGSLSARICVAELTHRKSERRPKLLDSTALPDPKRLWVLPTTIWLSDSSALMAGTGPAGAEAEIVDISGKIRWKGAGSAVSAPPAGKTKGFALLSEGQWTLYREG